MSKYYWLKILHRISTLQPGVLCSSGSISLHNEAPSRSAHSVYSCFFRRILTQRPW